MGRKKTKEGARGPSGPAAEPLSVRGKKAIGVGLGMILLGFFILALADPLGRNWAALSSPFLILGGYALVGLGILVPEEPPAPPPPPAA